MDFLKTPLYNKAHLEMNGRTFVFDSTSGMPTIKVNGRLIWSGIGVIRNFDELKKLMMEWIKS